MVIRMAVDVIMERVPVASHWVSEKWQPAAVIPVGEPIVGGGDITPGSPYLVQDVPDRTRWCFPRCSIDLHPSESEGYFLNMTSPQTGVFVMWRKFDDGDGPPARPVVVTASYDEAARMMDGGEQVDLVPMPQRVHAWVQAFVFEHYSPEPKKKLRRRDPLAAEGDAPSGDGRLRRSRDG